MPDHADIAVIGAGAAGLFAAIWAARTLRAADSDASVVAFDGAKTLGAKILVAGGGRCNVTHHAVDESAYASGAGSSRNAIKNVLRRFDVPKTIAFFEEFGVTLKREDTGKLFPTTDDAHTILDALLLAAREARAELVHPWRVDRVERIENGFAIHRQQGSMGARKHGSDGEVVIANRLILATGGKALPRSGSDGHGYTFAKALGHTITDTFPALVPLILSDEGSGRLIKDLSGLTLPAAIELHSGTGKKLVSFTNSTLCTHFGLSGPGVLDISRYYTHARTSDPSASLTLNWLPGMTLESADAFLAEAHKSTVLRRLAEKLPERLARALITAAAIDPAAQLGNVKRDLRRDLARRLVATPLPVTGDRGYTFAEVTAGGVPLSELHLDTMESRLCPNLHLCGEICDVDGRIGGFNFQWAWASGFTAGTAAANSLQ
ncbi:MAG TPA: aminoacetone oxidase family FAD-binding enzyme [Phycisphaerales bacterium]|nr:aminoacetone oxidase family FAD-binding enzyme [Phycisphaerales bacterium]